MQPMNPDMKPCFFKVSGERREESGSEEEEDKMKDRNKERERVTNREKKGE